MSLLENMGQMGYNYWDIVYGYYWITEMG
jgi:hypothetical protein